MSKPKAVDAGQANCPAERPVLSLRQALHPARSFRDDEYNRHIFPPNADIPATGRVYPDTYPPGENLPYPGIFWNQGLKLTVGYQYQDIGKHTYWLGNQIDMPRGADDEYGNKILYG